MKGVFAVRVFGIYRSPQITPGSRPAVDNIRDVNIQKIIGRRVLLIPDIGGTIRMKKYLLTIRRKTQLAVQRIISSFGQIIINGLIEITGPADLQRTIGVIFPRQNFSRRHILQ